MIICIARLRSNVNYEKPLQHIMDSFFYVMQEFIKRNPQHEYVFYNCGFGDNHKRNINAIKIADVVIIPSEAEFTYHIPGLVHTLDVKKSNEEIEKIKLFIQNKKIIILRSDRADDESLYRKVFQDVPFSYSEIDENDFDGSIHALKYYFMRKIYNPNFERTNDFIYWGTDKRKNPDGSKSGDIRHLILKEIKKSKLKTMFIGRFSFRDLRWMKMEKLIPFLSESRTTLCFNWKTNDLTSRYLEAVATGVFPFVFENYDLKKTMVLDDYQRIRDSNEFIEKCLKRDYNDNLMKEITRKVEETIKSPEEYICMFEKKLKDIL